MVRSPSLTPQYASSSMTSIEDHEVSVRFEDALLPTDPDAPSGWRRLRALLSSEFDPTRLGRNFRHYRLSDDKTILALKMAIIKDKRTLAGHLTPSDLRVLQIREDTGNWDPKLITFRPWEGKVQVERSDHLTIAECKNGDVDVTFSVGIRPSALGCLWERFHLYTTTHPWVNHVYWIYMIACFSMTVYVTVYTMLQEALVAE